MSEYFFEMVEQTTKQIHKIYEAPDPAIMRRYHRRSYLFRQFVFCSCGSCCLAVVVAIVGGIALAFIPRKETHPLYNMDTCMDPKNASAVSAVGSAETRLARPFPGTERPNLDAYPIWKSYFEEPQLYHRLHVHVQFLQTAPDNSERSGFLQENPDAILKVQAKGPDTGGAHFFQIGTHEFDPVKANSETDKIFNWDAKAAILYKFETTDSIEFVMTDQDTFSGTDNLMKCSIRVADLADPGGDWSDLQYRPSEIRSAYPELEGSRLAFHVKVSTGFFVTEADMDELLSDTDEIEYRERVLQLKSGDHALAQVWRSSQTPTQKAVLWVIGRNDGFHHAHVAKELFFNDDNNKVDLYVLNWRFNGQCQKRGFIDNPYYISHNPCGDINLYNEEVSLMLDLIQNTNGPYETLVGYGHSTGATILLNYVMEHGDDAFDGFLLNGPLLDWDSGTLNDLVLNNIPGTFRNSQFLKAPQGTPQEYQEEPLLYLGQEIAIEDAWAQRVYSMYYSEWAGSAQYSVPVTVGFARSVNKAFDKIKKLAKSSQQITSKPVLVQVSKNINQDPSLSSSSLDIVELSKTIHKDRMVIEYPYNGHDTFLSSDFADSMTAIQDAKEFFKEYFY